MNEYISKYSDLGDFNENKIIIFIPDDISYVVKRK